MVSNTPCRGEGSSSTPSTEQVIDKLRGNYGNMGAESLTDNLSIIRTLFRKADQQGRSKQRGESYSVPYVEPLRVARTPLAGFINSVIDERGGIVEMKAYQVPKSTQTPHGYKYSLVYIFNGRRLIGYDNHERKGDHRHHRTVTHPYAFKSVDRLIDDFLSDVAVIKKEIRS